MNFVSVFMACFSVLGAADLIFGNRLGIGKEFEKGFLLLGRMALSMIGMIVIAPVIGTVIQPVLDVLYRTLHLEPSVFPGMLLANDMGGAPLALAVVKDESLVLFNGLVVSSMMGCTVSFTIPVVLQMTDKAQHKSILSGLLCGIVTIPLGCFAAGLMLQIPLGKLLLNLAPMLLLSVLISLGLVFVPALCVKVFSVLGRIIQILITLGLVLGVLRYLTGLEIVPGLETLENAALICVNAAAVMSGAFPFMFLFGKLMNKPVHAFGQKMGINNASAFGLVSTLATSFTTFDAMKDMDDKGLTLNAAFAVSAGFTFAGHLAFTLSYDAGYIFPMIAGKLIAGVTALLVAALITKHK